MSEWREIPGFPGYEVSAIGEVRSWLPRGGARRRAAAPQLLKLGVTPSGYPKFTACVDRVHHTICVHRAVLLAFVGEPLFVTRRTWRAAE